jgi:hypothetical protein
MKKNTAVVLLCLALAAASCRGEEAEVSPEVRLARETAAQSACISDELLRRAESNLTQLDAASAGEDAPHAQVLGAARRFAHAYWQHATLRHAVYARADSAFNRSRSAADSARHIARGGQLRLTMAEEGTIEDNAIRAYQRDFHERRSDPDHLCSWARD